MKLGFHRTFICNCSSSYIDEQDPSRTLSRKFLFFDLFRIKHSFFFFFLLLPLVCFLYSTKIQSLYTYENKSWKLPS